MSTLDIYAMAYPDKFIINGKQIDGKRDVSKNLVKIPYSLTPDIGIGDTIQQISGNREILLKIVDLSFQEGATLKVGTILPHLLTLVVENSTSQMHTTKNETSSINIGSVSGSQFQIGNNNNQTANIQLQELVDKVSQSNDGEAKSLLKTLLENSTVGSIIGAGASTLLSLL